MIGMGSSTINSSAQSSKAIIKQFYVALDKCFELKPGQRVIIEKYGDVTVTGESQIEVKEYNDQLTDRHENFWKTLNNWMHPSFNDADYTSLILLTTQSYGSKTRLSMWNEGDTSRRLDILDTIYSESVLRESQRIAKGGAPKAISDSFKFQRLVMDTSRREKLDRICSKVIIASNSPTTDGLFEKLCERNRRTVLRDKVGEYINGLLGFIISKDEHSWDISCEDFDNAVASLSEVYRHGTRIFPTKYKSLTPPAPEEVSKYNKLFIHKIKDISYHTVIPYALRDYIYANQTILEEFKAYRIPPHFYTQFQANLRDQFEPTYRTSCRNCKDIMADSQDLYDRIMVMPPPPFSGFDSIDLGFKNGVMHIILDDDQSPLTWKLNMP